MMLRALGLAAVLALLPAVSDAISVMYESLERVISRAAVVVIADVVSTPNAGSCSILRAEALQNEALVIQHLTSR